MSYDAIRKYGIALILILLTIIFAISSPVFFTIENLFNVLRQISMLGISAVGMIFVILTGGIDLSVGSLMSLTNVICAKLMVESGLPPLLAISITLLISCLVGIVNAFFINEMDIPPLITTLGTMTIIRGLSYVLSGGRHIWGFPEGFKLLGQGHIGIIPIPVIIMFLIFIVGWIILYKTTYGRRIYGIGGNEEATRLSGINIKKIKYLVYMSCSLLTGLAGIIMLSRLNTGQPKIGGGYELEVVTAVVLGGVSIFGGVGKLSGVLFGVLIIGILSNGMILLNIMDYYQQIILGLVLLAAVGFDNKISKRDIG